MIAWNANTSKHARHQQCARVCSRSEDGRWTARTAGWRYVRAVQIIHMSEDGTAWYDCSRRRRGDLAFPKARPRENKGPSVPSPDAKMPNGTCLFNATSMASATLIYLLTASNSSSSAVRLISVLLVSSMHWKSHDYGLMRASKIIVYQSKQIGESTSSPLLRAFSSIDVVDDGSLLL